MRDSEPIWDRAQALLQVEKKKPDGPLRQLVHNAEYWHGFDLYNFEQWLLAAPEAIRLIGLGIALRYDETSSGKLGIDALVAAKQVAENLDADHASIFLEVCDLLRRGVEVQATASDWPAPSEATGDHGLASSTSEISIRFPPKVTLSVGGAKPSKKTPCVHSFGEVLTVSAKKASGSMHPVQIDSYANAPIRQRDTSGGTEFLILSPGEFRIHAKDDLDHFPLWVC